MQQEVPLEAEVEGGSGELTWFVDGALLGSARADERLWWTPSPWARTRSWSPTSAASAPAASLVVRERR